MTGIVALGFIATCTLLALGFKPGYIFEPTFAGIVWAGLFLCGFALGSIARGRIQAAVALSVFCWLANQAFAAITDFSASDSLFPSSLLLAFGFGAARVGTRNWTLFLENAFGRAVGEPTSTEHGHWRQEPLRFSIWDIGLATVLVAMVCTAISRTQASPALLACCFVALIGGIFSSWTACRWAWHDRWSLTSILGLGLACLLIFGYVIYRSPMPVATTITWLVSGPVNTIAAQATAVLVSCAAVRWELRATATPTRTC